MDMREKEGHAQYEIPYSIWDTNTDEKHDQLISRVRKEFGHRNNNIPADSLDKEQL
ncbi:hypothetical protein AB1K84_08615 [Mesobacillus foraminis]|uniref:hypothetical protein n=1 Tax=Mesobacillus foraminis TaxID=279826 RepID=UPI0039A12B48